MMTPSLSQSTPRRLARRVLIVEDEPGLLLPLSDRLKSEGYEVETAVDGESGESKAIEGAFDLIILDVMLPGKDGYDVCRELRKRSIATPILMLTARSQVVDKVVGLKLGADDYLTKPFEMIELLARVETLLRRGAVPMTNLEGGYAFGDIRVDFRSAEVRREGGHIIELSALEFKLLRYLIENRGAALSRDVLLNEVWGYDAMPYSRTVDVHIAALRQKIEPNPSRPRYILTLHGLGYKFVG